jgi:hypothetical protein
MGLATKFLAWSRVVAKEHLRGFRDRAKYGCKVLLFAEIALRIPDGHPRQESGLREAAPDGRGTLENSGYVSCEIGSEYAD